MAPPSPCAVFDENVLSVTVTVEAPVPPSSQAPPPSPLLGPLLFEEKVLLLILTAVVLAPPTTYIPPPSLPSPPVSFTPENVTDETDADTVNSRTALFPSILGLLAPVPLIVTLAVMFSGLPST